jgi:hypothetical protein
MAFCTTTIVLNSTVVSSATKVSLCYPSAPQIQLTRRKGARADLLTKTNASIRLAQNLARYVLGVSTQHATVLMEFAPHLRSKYGPKQLSGC